MEVKRISVSSKRQITIPLNYYNMLGIGDEVDCFIRDNTLVIRPVQDKSGGEFAEEILKDLVAQGYSGEELVSKFREQNRKVRKAVEKLIEQADAVATGRSTAATFDDIFGGEA